MKSLPPELQAHLDEGTTTLAWCWRIIRTDGATFGFTDHDIALVFDGTEFEPDSGFIASEIRAGKQLATQVERQRRCQQYGRAARGAVHASRGRAGIVMLASHSKELMHMFCNKGIKLSRGQIEAEGEIEELF